MKIGYLLKKALVTRLSHKHLLKEYSMLQALRCRFVNSKHRKKVLKAYDTKVITRIKELESMRVYSGRGNGLKDKSSR